MYSINKKAFSLIKTAENIFFERPNNQKQKNYAKGVGLEAVRHKHKNSLKHKKCICYLFTYLHIWFWKSSHVVFYGHDSAHFLKYVQEVRWQSCLVKFLQLEDNFSISWPETVLFHANKYVGQIDKLHSLFMYFVFESVNQVVCILRFFYVRSWKIRF